jgi:hypothetical protein
MADKAGLLEKAESPAAGGDRGDRGKGTRPAHRSTARPLPGRLGLNGVPRNEVDHEVTDIAIGVSSACRAGNFMINFCGWLGGWVAGWLGGWVAGWLGGWVAGAPREII